MKYHDINTQPIAIKLAEEIIRKEIGIEDLGESVAIITRREFYSGRVVYAVSYSAGFNDIYSMKEKVEITEAQFQEYQHWFGNVLRERNAESISESTKKLRAAGFYSTDSVGLTSAIKILSILKMSYSSFSATDVMNKELEIYLSPSDYVYENVDSSIILADSDGKMKVTARRALAALHTAGLIQKSGATSSMKYYI